MNIEIANVVEICPQLIIAVLTIAYPIIVDRCSTIGEKFNSKYLLKIFRSEFPEKRICKKSKNLSVLLFTLIVALISLLPLMLQFEPPFGRSNWFINNSALLFTLSMSIILTVFFIKWLFKIILYSGNVVELIDYLIRNKNDDYLLKTLNELTLYALEKQDPHLEKTLYEFYINYISNNKSKWERE